MPPRQLQLDGTASSSVGIGWYPSVGFDDKRLCGLCTRDCTGGSTIGVRVSTDRLTARSTTGGPPVFTDSPNCCLSELSTAEVLDGSAWYPAIEVEDAATIRRVGLECSVLSESSADARTGRLVLRG